jgi:pyruvate formate lyase activating enzyme
MLKQAYLYKSLPDKKVQCQTCAHYCQISPGGRGLCAARKNIDGQLYVLNYGQAAVINVDPIEKKPLFHFLPGSDTLSLGAVGCNFHCLNCQNWDISQEYKIAMKADQEVLGEYSDPEQIVNSALKSKIKSISYTYSEPTIFLEYALDIMKIAKKKGVKNVFVSNGFLSQEAIKLIAPYLDAANIDLKGFSEDFYKKFCGGELQPVLNTLKAIKKVGIWLEIATLVIPTMSDSAKTLKGIANFIKKELGAETPWHLSKFSSLHSWQLHHLPDTPLETLKMAYEIGKSAGLKYVYTGNMPGLPSEDTFCPKCKALIIDRTGYMVFRHDKNGLCPKCGQDINLILK